jgi:uncharacterized protein
MLYDLIVPQFSKMLHNLAAILDKGAQHAQTKKFDVEVLLQSRLAPDQFNLTRQIQIACDTAKFCAARLSGKEAPSHPDTEKSLPELKARLESVVGYLGSFTAKDFAGAETRRISTPRWEGSLSGAEYAFQHAVPNFYFHVTTAYAILRHNGVDVGKKDYLGKLPFAK